MSKPKKQIFTLCFLLGIQSGLTVQHISANESKVAETVLQGMQKQVTGSVIDEAGQPVIGATVKLKGSQLGTVTNMDGNFSLKVPEGSVIVSYIGYQTQELKAKEGAVLQVRLQPESKQLTEVVVTALGIKRAQKALSYNVQQVSSDDLVRNKDANFINSLAGKVAGVNINTSLNNQAMHFMLLMVFLCLT